MKEKAKNNVYISYSSVKKILNRRFHEIPKIYHYAMLKEMEELGMINKMENKPNIYYKFTGKDIDKLLNSYNILF